MNQPLASSWTVYDNSSSVHPLLVADQQEAAAPQIYEAVLWEKICRQKNQK